MADRSLKELDYAISFDINDNGLTRALSVENQLDKGLLGMATSATKVDDNISKMVNSTNKVNASTKGAAEALNTTSNNAQKASKNTDGINTSLSKSKISAKGVSDAFKSMNNNIVSNINLVDKLKGTMATIGIGFGVVEGVKSSVSSFANFEQQMAGVHATLGQVSNQDMTALTNQAVNLSNKWGIAAKDVAGAEEGLASAGFSVKEILDSTQPTVLLATAGHIDLAAAADDTSGAIRSFGLTTKDSAHVVDVYAKAAADTNAQMGDMAEAMKYAAQPAHAAGMSMEETAGAIGIMANSSIKGSTAGTTLRSMLSSLAKPSAEAAKLMQITGFNAYNSQGKMKSLSGVIDNLKTSTSKLTDQEKQYYLTTLFGQESMSGMLALVSSGPDELDKLTESFKNSDGAAKQMAETQNDTLAGSLSKLKTNVENTSAAIAKDTGFIDWIKNVADSLVQYKPQITNDLLYITKVAGDFGKTIKENWTGIAPIITEVAVALGTLKAVLAIQGAISLLAGLGAFAGPLGLLALAIGGVAAGIVEIKQGFTGIGSLVTGASVGFGTLAVAMMIFGGLTWPIIAVALAVGGITAAILYCKTHWSQLSAGFSSGWEAIKGTWYDGVNYILEKANKFISKINEVITVLDKIPGVNIPTITPFQYYGDKKKDTKSKSTDKPTTDFAAAQGTYNSMGGMTLIGEYGPEILNIPSGAQIIPANATSSLLNQTNDTSFNSTINDYDKSLNKVMPKFSEYGKQINNNLGNGIIDKSSFVTSSLTGTMTNGENVLSTFARSGHTYGSGVVDEMSQGITDSAVNLTTVVQNLTDKVVTTFKTGFGIHSPSRIMYSIGSFLMQGLVNGMSDKDVNGFLQDKIGSMIAVSTSAMGGNVSAWLTSALAATGTPLDWLPGLLKLVSAESGGDPNNWNPQSVGGEHATGLLQTLPSTFSQFMQPGMNNILNPVDNAASAINYIKSRYGSVYNTPLFRGGPYVGYANGTDNATPGLHLVGERGPEILAFNGGEKVLDNDKSKQIFNQSKPYASSNGSNAVIQSTPNIEINIQESKDAKTTAMEVEKILRKLFPQLFDKEMVKIGIQMGYTPIVES